MAQNSSKKRRSTTTPSSNTKVMKTDEPTEGGNDRCNQDQDQSEQSTADDRPTVTAVVEQDTELSMDHSESDSE